MQNQQKQQQHAVQKQNEHVFQNTNVVDGALMSCFNSN